MFIKFRGPGPTTLGEYDSVVCIAMKKRVFVRGMLALIRMGVLKCLYHLESSVVTNARYLLHSQGSSVRTHLWCSVGLGPSEMTVETSLVSCFGRRNEQRDRHCKLPAMCSLNVSQIKGIFFSSKITKVTFKRWRIQLWRCAVIRSFHIFSFCIDIHVPPLFKMLRRLVHIFIKQKHFI